MARQTTITVQGKPFFPVGCQTHNSSFYRLEELSQAMAAVKAVGGNSIATPIGWDAFEPEEGTFNHELVTGIIDLARREGIHLCLLWFGTWKNGMMEYAPRWVKNNPERFHRVKTRDGYEADALSCYCKANLEADCKAFRELLRLLRDYDGDTQTVYAVQVENEPGNISGTSRDFSPEADAVFQGPVPEYVLSYAQAHPGRPLHDAWVKGGSRTSGAWTEVFGRLGPEYFQAHAVASYIDEVARQGKEEYDLFMYINVWLDGFTWDLPGLDYPAGGAVPRSVDVWRATMRSLDTIAPDIYFPTRSDYLRFCDVYSQDGFALYIPESSATSQNYSCMFYAVGACGGVGIHIFGIEDMIDDEGRVRPECEPCARSFRILSAAAPLIHRFRGTGRMYAISQELCQLRQFIDVDGYRVRVDYGRQNPGWMDYHHLEDNRAIMGDEELPLGRGLLFQESEKVFYLCGEGFRISISDLPREDGSLRIQQAVPFLQRHNQGVISLQEGHIAEDGAFVCDRVRSGDEYTFWTAADCGVIRIELR